VAREDWDWERITNQHPDEPSWDDIWLATTDHGLTRGRSIGVPVAAMDDFIAWLQEIRDEVRKDRVP